MSLLDDGIKIANKLLVFKGADFMGGVYIATVEPLNNGQVDAGVFPLFGFYWYNYSL